MKGIAFPPLLTGLAVAGDPFEIACDAAAEAEPGTVFYSPDEDSLQASVLLAPETPLGEAISVSFAVSLGLNDAIGTLAPPEIAFHLEWLGAFRVNGATCGGMRARASMAEPAVEPDWLAIGLEVPVRGVIAEDPGLAPDRTTLHAEGCHELTVPDLTEMWARHMMTWLHTYMTEGFGPLHAHWCARAHRIGEDIDSPEPGRFIGLDERGGMILKDETGTRILPLTRLLEAT